MELSNVLVLTIPKPKIDPELMFVGNNMGIFESHSLLSLN